MRQGLEARAQGDRATAECASGVDARALPITIAQPIPEKQFLGFAGAFGAARKQQLYFRPARRGGHAMCVTALNAPRWAG
jgi:hypothetical protein